MEAGVRERRPEKVRLFFFPVPVFLAPIRLFPCSCYNYCAREESGAVREEWNMTGRYESVSREQVPLIGQSEERAPQTNGDKRDAGLRFIFLFFFSSAPPLLCVSLVCRGAIGRGYGLVQAVKGSQRSKDIVFFFFLYSSFFPSSFFLPHSLPAHLGELPAADKGLRTGWAQKER